MIIKEQPSVLRLFFKMQGSIVPKIRGNILSIALISIVVLFMDDILPLPHFSISAMGVFGIALSLFSGFRNNLAYD